MSKNVRAKSTTSKSTRDAFLRSVRELATSRLDTRRAKAGSAISLAEFVPLFRSSLYFYREALKPWLLRRDAQSVREQYQRRLEKLAQATTDKAHRRRLERAIDRLGKDAEAISRACDELDARPPAAAAGHLDDLPPETILARIAEEADEPNSLMMRTLTHVVGPHVADADLACVFALVATWYPAWTGVSTAPEALDAVRRAIYKRRADAAKRRAKLESDATRRAARDRRLSTSVSDLERVERDQLGARLVVAGRAPAQVWADPFEAPGTRALVPALAGLPLEQLRACVARAESDRIRAPIERSASPRERIRASSGPPRSVT